MTVSIIAAMVKEAESHADNMAQDRLRAVEYYQGKMEDTPSDEGRSAMVSKDVRATIKKVLPSMMRTILGNEKIVEYMPVNEGDEAAAEQATDYVNGVVFAESDAYQAIEAAIHDALLLRNGVLHVSFEERKDVRFSEHTGLPDDAFAQLVQGEDIEVLEHSENVQITDMGPVTLHDAKIKRYVTTRSIKASAVPRERFLIHPDAITLADSVLTGSKTQVRRSDLVSMGYDKDTVYALAQGDSDDDLERDERRDIVTQEDEADIANELIDYYDLYVRTDQDGDGIAELHHVCFAGGLGENNLLMDENADEVQYYDVKVLAQPHQWEGISLFDDIADIQRVKTVLLRQTLDNLYWQNNPQPVMQEGVILNPEAVYNPEFGLPIKVRQGTDARAALSFNQVPFVAAQSFAMLDYMDNEAQERTGVTDASSGLAPDALQNMTAKASAMIEAAGIGQTELMVRTVAHGLRAFFRGVLRLTIKHQDVPRTVRLRGEWVQVDPRQWNAEMDCTVNTGLGAGTRERDMQVMQFVMGMQEKLLAAFGAANNPFVTPENLYSSLEQLVQAAGMKSAGRYFTAPDPAAIQAKIEQQANQPSPEMMKVQAQQQEAQARMQMDMQKAQMDAQMQTAKMQQDSQLARDRMVADIELQREKMRAEAALAQEKMAAEFELKRQQMQLEAAIGVRSNMGGDVQFGGAVG